MTSNQKYIDHWHYTGWPDSEGIPKDNDIEAFKHLLDFLSDHIMNAEQNEDVLIHCLDGRGQSGTLIAILAQWIMHKMQKQETEKALKGRIATLLSNRAKFDTDNYRVTEQ